MASAHFLACLLRRTIMSLPGIQLGAAYPSRAHQVLLGLPISSLRHPDAAGVVTEGKSIAIESHHHVVPGGHHVPHDIWIGVCAVADDNVSGGHRKTPPRLSTPHIRQVKKVASQSHQIDGINESSNRSLCCRFRRSLARRCDVLNKVRRPPITILSHEQSRNARLESEPTKNGASILLGRKRCWRSKGIF